MAATMGFRHYLELKMVYFDTLTLGGSILAFLYVFRILIHSKNRIRSTLKDSQGSPLRILIILACHFLWRASFALALQNLILGWPVAPSRFRAAWPIAMAPSALCFGALLYF